MSPGAVTAVAFFAALALSLAVTPVLRGFAVRLGVLDHPDEARSYKQHARPIPYLGGFAILLAVFVIAASAGVWRQAVVVGLSAFLLFTVGLLDDLRGGVGLWFRVLIQSAVAVATVVLGEIDVDVTGIAALNSVLIVVWLVGMTNSVNILDNCNGIAAGTAALGGGAFALLATFEGQYVVGAMGASLAGASLGFLPYNFPKARVFMGDAGTIPLGYLLGLVAVQVDVDIAHPWNFILPVAVLALPVVNTIVVLLHRLRIGQSFYVGGIDSLWHRLVVLGLHGTTGVVVLLSASCVLGALSVLSGAGVLPPYVPTLGLAAGLGLGLLALRVDVRAAAPALEGRQASGANGGPSVAAGRPRGRASAD